MADFCRSALALLDYDDDDEMVALGRINPDGSVALRTAATRTPMTVTNGQSPV